MKRHIKLLIYSLILGIISLILVSILWAYPFYLLLLLVVISAILLVIYNNKEDLYLFIFCATWGALSEIVAIAFGAWVYSAPEFAGIPYWLPLLWGIAALYIKKISVEIHIFLRK